MLYVSPFFQRIKSVCMHLSSIASKYFCVILQTLDITLNDADLVLELFSSIILRLILTFEIKDYECFIDKKYLSWFYLLHHILSTKWLNPNLDKILMFVSHVVHAVVDYKENYVVRSRNEWKLI